MAFSQAQEDILRSVADALLSAIGRGPAPAKSNGARTAEAAASVGAGGYTNGLAASDTDLNGEYSDREIKRDPKRWAGRSYVGSRWSECDPEYLDVLAESLEYFADKDAQKPPGEAKKSDKTGKPYFEYDRKDARLIRAWAKRLRAGGVVEQVTKRPAATSAPVDPGYDDAPLDDSEVPF